MSLLIRSKTKESSVVNVPSTLNDKPKSAAPPPPGLLLPMLKPSLIGAIPSTVSVDEMLKLVIENRESVRLTVREIVGSGLKSEPFP